VANNNHQHINKIERVVYILRGFVCCS